MSRLAKLILLVLIVTAFVSVCFHVITFAHSGSTDANGGHYDKETGQYHYHHGYPAHQHIGGICPYNYDDKTNHNNDYDYKTSNSNSHSSNSYNPSYQRDDDYEEDHIIFWRVLLITTIMNVLFVLFFEIYLYNRKLPDWVMTIISLSFIGMYIGEIICLVISIIPTLISGIVVFGGYYYGIKKIVKYSRKKSSIEGNE